MKNLIIIGLMLTFATGAFAGILENRRTGETIEFILNRADREIDILSTAKNVGNKTILLENIGEGRSDVQLLGGIKWAISEQKNSYRQTSGYDPGAKILLTPAMVVYDLIALPLKAPIKLFQNMARSRDFTKLMNAINSTDQIRVSNGRFRRIEKLLNHQR